MIPTARVARARWDNICLPVNTQKNAINCLNCAFFFISNVFTHVSPYYNSPGQLQYFLVLWFPSRLAQYFFSIIISHYYYLYICSSQSILTISRIPLSILTFLYLFLVSPFHWMFYFSFSSRPIPKVSTSIKSSILQNVSYLCHILSSSNLKNFVSSFLETQCNSCVLIICQCWNLELMFYSPIYNFLDQSLIFICLGSDIMTSKHFNCFR